MKSYAAILFTFLYAVVFSNCTGTRPTNIGIREGRLADCPSTPNCVASHLSPNDTEHFIQALTYPGSAQDARTKLVGVIQSLPRTNIVTNKEDYIYAEFTSFTFRFVDDVEFYFPAGTKNIQVRSASRLGRSDFGVNRNRIEKIRGLFSN
ncbi:hypothetical protein CH373_08630 [Leptospira perolatii]|uniref:DUF1499 domain-containing protein n=1 Tax=Leptospira perolatii TaxID=2023191 RepID=A0A2M9ZN98_9LEPT|nr:DUF1499 domain-containing protein [Leptospira perolatii]PJZ69571.1 hypothetical protein CH360_09775 [Leptospira perolatii]PJZ73558.1 hypothetical protein CH373_08630 [Leptospira perolatii]